MSADDSGFIVGIDLGGTKILSVCLDASREVVGRDYRETQAPDGPDAVIARMVESAKAAAAGRPLRGVGVSAPGPADLERGVITIAPNLPGWRDIPLQRLISDQLGVPAWIENDANAGAFAEHRIGAGRGSRHMVLVAVGTDIGGGLVFDGAVYHGASGGAGEIGHMQMDPSGPVCTCGRTGCLGALAGGRALNAAAQQIAAAEPEGLLARLSRSESAEPDARILDSAAEAGDASAVQALKRAGAYLGAGLTDLVNVLNPNAIVIGGSVRRSELYLQTAIETMQRDAFEQHRGDVRVVLAELGDDAPAMGAALIALEHLDEGTEGA
jgi:glucokinase